MPSTFPNRHWRIPTTPNPPGATMTNLPRAVRRALATFIFATTGALIGNPLLDMDVAQWKLVAGVALGSALNLLYRWAEAVMKEPEPVDNPGGPANIGDH